MQVVRKSVFHSHGAYGYHRISTLLENGANGISRAWHAVELANRCTGTRQGCARSYGIRVAVHVQHMGSGAVPRGFKL